MPPRAATPKEAKAELENRKASTLSLSSKTSQNEVKEVETEAI